MHVLDDFRRWLTTIIGTVLGTIWLFALYVGSGWLVVGSLSAIQVRDSVAEYNLPFNFTDTDQAEDWLLRAQNRIYADLQRKDVLSQKQNAQYSLLQNIEVNFGDPNASGEYYYDYWDPETSPEFQEAERACLPMPDLVDERYPPCEDLYEYLALSAEIKALYDGGILEKIAESEKAALVQFQQIKSLSNFVDVNRFFDAMWYTPFLKAPREILVMLLTIIMGVLGSVITMTWTFVRRDSSLSVRRFLILPFVGGMSAFIILIFLKAGQLTLTAGGTTDELSPFVLSFVGIISGLLSERAYARMSEVGSSVFRVHEAKLRWGIHLTAALAGAGLTVTDVARHLALDDGDVEKIVDGKAPADPVQQRLIAALLRAEPRDLFTDIPPADAAPRPDPDDGPPGPPAPAIV